MPLASWGESGIDARERVVVAVTATVRPSGRWYSSWERSGICLLRCFATAARARGEQVGVTFSPKPKIIDAPTSKVVALALETAAAAARDEKRPTQHPGTLGTPAGVAVTSHRMPESRFTIASLLGPVPPLC